MNLGVLIPIVAIIASAWVVVAVLRFAQEKRSAEALASPEKAELARENEALRETVARLEQRIAVLERIATDPAERTARDIESLR